jgi:hypothetical protein
MCHLFIDFKADYDSMNKTKLYLAMEEIQIPKKHISLVKVIMRNTQYQLRIQATLSEPLRTKIRVSQGDAPSMPVV